jgi:Flp pilus assembly protein TadB
MTTIIYSFLAVFLLLSTAIFLFFRLDLLLRESMKRSSVKHRKIKLFKKQTTLSRKLASLAEKRRAIIEHSEMPKTAYYVLTAACAGIGIFAGRVIYSSLLISAVVGIMGLFAPLLLFSLRRTKTQNARLNRLVASMMILSNSYLVTEDFITTVKDNVDILEYPEPFRDFLAYVTLMDSDLKNGLRRMEDQVNNGYFSQWVDALVLAQDDRELKYVAVSVVESMHDVLQAQMESDAAMYAVWRDYLLTLFLIFSVPLVFKILMADAYVALTTSPIGQGLFVLLLASVVYSVFRALKINRPLML